jgi:DNA-binding IclR family transcriptional regulator
METAQTGDLALRAVAEVSGRGPTTVAHLADALAISRTATQRIVATLHHCGVVRRLADGRYDVGLGLIPLAAGAGRAFARSAAPIVRECAASAGTTVVLALRDGDEAVVARQAVGPSQSMQLEYRDGFRTPLTRGAGGLAILASLPDDDPARRDAALGVAVAPGLLDRIARDGYAVTEGAVRPGLLGVAAPVTSSAAGVIASIAAVTPARCAPAISLLASTVRDAAAQLSALADQSHGNPPMHGNEPQHRQVPGRG